MKLLRDGKSFSGHERNCLFVNRGDGQFADASSIGGVDFPDDGRGLVAVDWDHDGDLDLWITNRTGPRLRFLRNNSTSCQQSIELELRGQKCNRDAIGARVTVALKRSDHSEHGTLVKSVYAGDGFLSQSTGHLHFGIPPDAQIDHVTVRWPGGDTEEFAINATGRYVLVEGDASALLAEKRTPIAWQESVASATSPPAATRTILANRPPAPTFPIVTATGQPSDLQPADHAVVVSLWSNSCVTCIREIKAWSERRSQFDQLGAAIHLLSVDRLAETANGDSTWSPPTWAQVLRAPFSIGHATPATIDKLNILRRVAVNQPANLVVPLTFLFDRRGQLAVLYRGAVSADQLASDIEQFANQPFTSRDLAIPFPGRWLAPPRRLLLRPVADLFLEHGYLADYGAIRSREAARLREELDRVTDDAERKQIARRYALECFSVGHVEQARQNWDSSIEYFRDGIELLPEVAAPHYYLALAYDATDRREEAVAALSRCLEIDPAFTDARLRLARLIASNDRESAIELLREAIAHDPQHADAHHTARPAAFSEQRDRTGLDSVPWRRRIGSDECRGPD